MLESVGAKLVSYRLLTSLIAAGSDSSTIMPNLLDFPFKRTYEINLKGAVRDFISFHGGGHPDEFKSDIQQWQDLRKNAVGDVVHVDRIQAMLLWVSAFPQCYYFIPISRLLSSRTVTTHN